MNKKIFFGVSLFFLATINTSQAKMVYFNDHNPDSSNLMETRTILKDLDTNNVVGFNKPFLSKNVNISLGGSAVFKTKKIFKSVVVVDPTIANAVLSSTKQASIIANKLGTTNIIFTDDKGNNYVVSVNVTVNIDKITRKIKKLLPNNHIELQLVNNSVYVSGSVKTPGDATEISQVLSQYFKPTQIINHLSILESDQILLEVKVAEVDKNILKNLGINFNLNKSSNLSLALLNGGTGPNSIGLTGSPLGTAISTALSALEQNGIVKTLQEPTLVTTSGKTASLFAGGQYPVPSISQQGGVATTYQNFGVSLSFTPTIVSANNIQLNINTSVSSVGSSVSFPVGNTTTSLPIFNTQSAKTFVSLPSGGGIMIAGLLSNNFKNSVSGVPGLMKVPVLGKLGGNTNYSAEQEELLISVKAFLVNPTNPSKIETPDDYILPPTNMDIYIWNKLVADNPKATKLIKEQQINKFGFITSGGI